MQVLDPAHVCQRSHPSIFGTSNRRYSYVSSFTHTVTVISTVFMSYERIFTNTTGRVTNIPGPVSCWGCTLFSFSALFYA